MKNFYFFTLLVILLIGGLTLNFPIQFDNGIPAASKAYAEGWREVTGKREGRFSQVGNKKDWKDVKIGDGSGMALKEDGTIWRLEITTGFTKSVGNKLKKFPGHIKIKQIGKDNDWKKISIFSTGFAFVALKKDTTLWGFSYKGGKKLSGSDWIIISGTYMHFAGIRKDGSLWVKGSNIFGQLGIGKQVVSITYKDPFQKMGTDTDWAAVSAGGGHTSAIKKDGTLWIWGGGGSAQDDTIVP